MNYREGWGVIRKANGPFKVERLPGDHRFAFYGGPFLKYTAWLPECQWKISKGFVHLRRSHCLYVVLGLVKYKRKVSSKVHFLIFFFRVGCVCLYPSWFYMLGGHTITFGYKVMNIVVLCLGFTYNYLISKQV